MTPGALRDSLCRLGLSQTGAAALTGVDGRTMRRWCAGEREVPPPVERLLWAMQRDPTLVAALREQDFSPQSAPAAPAA